MTHAIPPFPHLAHTLFSTKKHNERTELMTKVKHIYTYIDIH